MWGTRPSCHGDTPPIDNLSNTPPWSRPSEGQLMGAEEAKVTLVLGPRIRFVCLFVSSSKASRLLTRIGGLGEEV